MRLKKVKVIYKLEVPEEPELFREKRYYFELPPHNRIIQWGNNLYCVTGVFENWDENTVEINLREE